MSAVCICDEYVSGVDLSGQLIVWKINEKQPEKNLFQFPFQTMLRSIAMQLKNENQFEIFVGSLEGHVIRVLLKIQNDHCELLNNSQVVLLKGGITSIKFFENIEEQNLKRVLIGTTQGYIALLDELTEGYQIHFVFQAHKPEKQNLDLRFGSLVHFAEIWSICVSPQKMHIASSSEDQTAVIWDIQGNKCHTFVGHSTAVTACDWKKTENSELFLTCGDDQKVIVWELNEKNEMSKLKWVLKMCLQTSEFGLDWHTLTYLKFCVFKGKQFIFVSTQNGYLFCWDFDKNLLFDQKIHFGSIEGMDVQQNENFLQIVTCGSDCNVGIFTYNQL